MIRSSDEKGQALALKKWGQLALLAGVLIWAAYGSELNFVALVMNAGNMLDLLGDFYPPDFREWNYYLEEMLVTLQIAICGTVLAVVTAVPLSVLASNNIVPSYIRVPTRVSMDLLRSINALVFAMLFVVIVGLGPFAGVLAIWIHTTGVLTKMYSEAIEAVDPGQVIGVRACGASLLGEIRYGIIPQVVPHLISNSLYRLESNIRSATVLGLVGGGGIGMVLWEYIRGFQFQKVSVIILIVVVVVSLVDMSSSVIRKQFI